MKLRFPFIIISAFLLMAVMSSCTRDYICQCTIKYSGHPGLPDSIVKEYPVKDTKKKAQSVCEANSGRYESNGIITEEKCHLY